MKLRRHCLLEQRFVPNEKRLEKTVFDGALGNSSGCTYATDTDRDAENNTEHQHLNPTAAGITLMSQYMPAAGCCSFDQQVDLAAQGAVCNEVRCVPKCEYESK